MCIWHIEIETVAYWLWHTLFTLFTQILHIKGIQLVKHGVAFIVKGSQKTEN